MPSLSLPAYFSELSVIVGMKFEGAILNPSSSSCKAVYLTIIINTLTWYYDSILNYTMLNLLNIWIWEFIPHLLFPSLSSLSFFLSSPYPCLSSFPSFPFYPCHPRVNHITSLKHTYVTQCRCWQQIIPRLLALMLSILDWLDWKRQQLNRICSPFHLLHLLSVKYDITYDMLKAVVLLIELTGSSLFLKMARDPPSSASG